MPLPVPFSGRGAGEYALLITLAANIQHRLPRDSGEPNMPDEQEGLRSASPLTSTPSARTRRGVARRIALVALALLPALTTGGRLQAQEPGRALSEDSVGTA